MSLILKFKNWQVFFLTIGSLMVYQLVMITLTTNYEQYITLAKYLAPIVIFFSLGSYFFWLLSLGLNLKIRVSSKRNIADKLFIASFIYALGFTLFTPIYFIFILQGEFPDSFYFLLSQLLFFASVTNCLLYISKLLSVVEFNNRIKNSEVITTFILLLLFPVGIWIIQPRINKIFIDQK